MGMIRQAEWARRVMYGLSPSFVPSSAETITSPLPNTSFTVLVVKEYIFEKALSYIYYVVFKT